MSTIDFTSPRARGVPYILTCIATATVFGHMSEFCVEAVDCTSLEWTVLSFGVLGAFFSLLLLLGAILAIPKLRFMELSLSCLLFSVCLVLATIASLKDLQADMREGAGEIFKEITGSGFVLSDLSGPIFWEIVVGFSWAAFFIAVAALYHLVLYGLRLEGKGKVVEEDTKA